MLCKKPYMKGVLPLPCGQCLHCRINKRREWSNRLMMEKESSTVASFVTLTYRDEELNDISSADWNASRPVVATLVPKHTQEWLKRIRLTCSRKYGIHRLRYYVVGEYGEDKGRPHYHAALFGFPPCVNGKTRKHLRRCCGPCNILRDSWGFGAIQSLELNKDLAQYLAKYVTKKWTKENSWTKERLKGRHPEFARMSLKPGIGTDAIMSAVTGTVLRRTGKYLLRSIDAPAVLVKSGSIVPLGRYLRRKWREALGRNQDAPKTELERFTKEMQKLYEEERNVEMLAGTPRSFIDPQTIYITKNRQKLLNAEKRSKIFSQKGSL